jgi:hypothetical protein
MAGEGRFREEVRAGDWVRFVRGGFTVVAEVGYIDPDHPDGVAVFTSDGAVFMRDVLEVRHASPGDQ